MQAADGLLVIHLVDRQPDGYMFERSRQGWPLHITLVPWFYGADEASVREALQEYALSQQSYTVKIGAKELFGPNKDIPVNVITDQAALFSVHEELLDVIAGLGGTLFADEQEWVRTNYRAHITQHGDRGAQEGATELIDAFTLVRLLPENKCEVIKTFQCQELSS